MSETLLPMVEEEWKKPPLPSRSGGSLITPLGVVEGEVLTHLEQYGATPLRRLTRELEWPSPMITMAVGALIREGLARAAQHELEVIIECLPQSPAPGIQKPAPAPEVWGG